MRIRSSLVVLALAAVYACGGGGDEAEESPEQAGAVDSAALQRTAAATIQPGMSQDEVRNTLGEPRTRVTMDGGFERWTYYNYDSQGTIAARTLIIFGNDGKVVEVNDR
ncbi:MAG: outer membrane protein assembly factor BamE [Gemmatimonadota bacterium]|nr:outer membrane protein assembly factor BamE [Gemmatimonadota bacterium]